MSLTPVTVTPDPIKCSELVGERYRIKSQLMECRFSELYRATDELTGLPLVLRKLKGNAAPGSTQSAQAQEARLQTVREARTLASLRHRNIPRFFTLLEEDGNTYLLLEDMPGSTLEQTAPGAWGKVQPELVRRYLNQLLSVVGFLHSQTPPIIHRDLRPETVLVSPMGVLKIGEFGLAKMGADAATAETAFRSKGDSHFASPEQLMGEASHPRHDLYSIGAILYYLSTGEKPPQALSRMSPGAEFRTVQQLRSGFPSDLSKVIEALLCPDPAGRPESVEAVQSMLGGERPEHRLPQLMLEEPATKIELVEEPEHAPSLIDPEAETERMEPPAAEKSAQKSSMWSLLFGRGKKPQGDSIEEPAETQKMPVEEGDFPFVDLATLSLDRKIGQTLSEALSRTIDGVCIGRVADNVITVACEDPSDVHIYDNIAMAATADFKVTLVRAEGQLIRTALDFIFRSQHLAASTSWEVYLEQRQLDAEKLVMTSQSAPVNFDDEALEGPIVDAVDQIIKEAISAGTSDIHLEPYEDGMDVRYRIDGVLRKVNRISAKDMGAVVKRLKVMGNLDIAQQRQTQGGRISLRVGSKEYDLRVSVIPVPSGESVVMRVLKKGAFTLTLSDLGFDKSREDQFRSMLTQPYGMILVCGPTGSGKSTTLYASLKEIARPDRKLLTVEDPIEYQMDGIMQVQVNRAPKEEEKKLTFSRALREFLRQDPDVILVGEIRDQETAEIGIQAALTGHLLLSTIHTNDAIGIVSRLRDMQCEPFLISSVLLGGLAQRLARRLCPNCRVEAEVPKQYLSLFYQHGITTPKAFRCEGCRECNHTGSRGRVGIYELLEITTKIRNHITNSDSEEEIRETALSEGYRPLLADGLDKVTQGIVSLEEVLRVCRTVGQSKSEGDNL